MGQRHDDAREEWAHLSGYGLTSSRVGTEPKIFYGNELSAGNAQTHHVRSCPCSGRNERRRRCTCLGPESRGDVLAHGFWLNQRSCIFDIRIVDTDAKSYGNSASDKILERHARMKKGDYEEACLENRRDFTPMV